MLIYRYKERLKEDKSIEQKRKSEAGREKGQEIETKQEKKEAKTLNEMTVPELKEIAKEKDIEGYSNMKKKELIKALEEGD